MIFDTLQEELQGDLFTDDLHRILYATDASSYRELPLAVTLPGNKEDIKKIIEFARANNSSVIPRGAGTSLAGQVVGAGIIADVSKYLTKILDFNPAEKWVVVEPGVILAELNQFLSAYGLQFGPETSTANRCCMGGMLGNNSCGLHSLLYGSVRDHILEVNAILSDGTEAVFGEISTEEFFSKCNSNPDLLETKIYRNIRDILSNPANQVEIRKQYPDPRVKRRNNGYALDALLETDPFVQNGTKINICRLLAGSEGTLAFTTAMKLSLVSLSKKKTGLVCAHFKNMDEAVRANLIALKHHPAAIEMIDDFILDCTKQNIEQRKNRFFIRGNPKIVLLMEFLRDTKKEIEETVFRLEKELRDGGYGYHYPLFTEEEEIMKVWELRKAGLGVLLNIPGERRSVQVIEDTSVLPEVFPEYISEFELVLKKYNLNCAYYGHMATGELHLSPLLNLKDPEDIKIYKYLAKEIAMLVKKYHGSLSGEHGDGRLRGEFIPYMLGENNYRLLKLLKNTWDPLNIFNPGKIIDSPSLTENLRYPVGKRPGIPRSVFNIPGQEDLLFAIEKCSGSGDCRKSSFIGGTMCPTFMATKDEDKTTRGRANVLREYLTRSEKRNPFDHDEIYQVMDLCLSCKACKSECPSNVDMTRFKAEFLYHYYETHGIPFRSWLIAWLPKLNSLGRVFRPLTNLLTGTLFFKKLVGFAPYRKIPALSKITLRHWNKKHSSTCTDGQNSNGKVYLFADEFTNYNESDIGIKAILLLEKLGYEIVIPRHIESGRTLLSKGLLNKAKKVARENIMLLKDIISKDTPLIGIEPSAILTFRDEYPWLVEKDLKDDATKLGENSLMFDEFICCELEKGRIKPSQFTLESKLIKLHGHCQQKAIASTSATKKMLSIPANYIVEEIPSGCCGMAGSFGYEMEHFELSKKIGEMVLFPAVRDASDETLIVAPGTSCRLHISEGTGKSVFHPVEIMYKAISVSY
jgi:FAD/FMN-containing dehydrogenase/Fe-S oxidoreductase